MSRASEDVLLIVKHVKYKKVEGSMYVMSTRAAWMNQTGNTFRVSAPYESVRVQRISPDTKEKVQLQLLLLDGASYTFHFTNPSGKSQQLEDRNSVKEMLQQLLPKFKDKVNSELEAKNKILQKRPELFQLYKDLVVSNIVSPEEFWVNQEKADAAAADKLGVSSSNTETVGVSGHFLSDIKPQVDGANGMKYHLTNDTVLSIFKTYPAVEECHRRYVPHKITETDFWIKFFQSHYFHRDRLHIAKDDLFSDCAQRDEQQLKDASRVRLEDPLVDLTGVTDHDIGMGYGLDEPPEDEEKVESGGGRLATTRTSSVTTAHLANLQLIRRFNHHSLMVLKVGESSKEKEKKDDKGKRKSPSTDEDGDPEIKRRRLAEQTKLDELELESQTSDASLRVVDQIERYLQGPTLQQRSRLYVSQDDAYRAAITVRSQLSQWSDLQLDKCINHYAAVKALGALSTSAVASGATTSGSTGVGAGIGSSGSVNAGVSGPIGEGSGVAGGGDNSDSVANLLTPDQNKELSQLHSALSELLRHFWLCFPVNSSDLETKAERMFTCLKKFDEQKLRPYRERVMSSIPNSVKEVDVTGHLENMLEAAYRRYNMWKKKNRR